MFAEGNKGGDQSYDKDAIVKEEHDETETYEPALNSGLPTREQLKKAVGVLQGERGNAELQKPTEAEIAHFNALMSLIDEAIMQNDKVGIKTRVKTLIEDYVNQADDAIVISGFRNIIKRLLGELKKPIPKRNGLTAKQYYDGLFEQISLIRTLHSDEIKKINARKRKS